MKMLWIIVFIFCISLFTYLGLELNSEAPQPSLSVQPDLDNTRAPNNKSRLTLLTEHSPPGAYLDASGHIQGKTVELIEIISQRLGEKTSVDILPWARALKLAKTQTNMGLFETIKSEERKDWFHWVGPLKIYDIALYGREDNITLPLSHNIIVTTLVACANRGSSYVDYLQELGFKIGRNLVLTVNEDNCGKLMIQGKVDLAPYNEQSIETMATKLDQQITLIPVLPLSQISLYLAFSKDISEERVGQWQQALEQSYRDGTMRKLYSGTYNEKLISRLEALVNNRP
jgi:polar amino acid transport system substrate-binding protein